MINNKMDKSKIKLAQIKYFDKKNNGIEVNDIDAYAFLYEEDGHYVNLLNPLADLPVYKRVPYSNVTSSGEEYGTKIVHEQGEIKDGLCYVVGFTKMEELFGDKDIDLETIKNYILSSSKFFVDRILIISNMLGNAGTRGKKMLKKTFEADSEMMNKLFEFADSHEKGYQYKKEMF